MGLEAERGVCCRAHLQSSSKGAAALMVGGSRVKLNVEQILRLVFEAIYGCDVDCSRHGMEWWRTYKEHSQRVD